jgi:branched-chain amino acid transport system permease protein
VISRRPQAVAQQVLMIVAAVLILLGVAAWLITKLVTQPALFLSSAMAGLQNGVLFALIALGYTLVYGIIELINFAHGDLFMLSTLFAGAMILIGCMAFGGTVNVAIELVAYRRLRHAPKLAPLITAVGMSFILLFFGLLWNGSAPTSNWKSVLPQGAWDLGGVRVEHKFLVVVGMAVPLLLLMSWIVTSTRTGKAMRAVAQDQDAARLMGINVNRICSAASATSPARCSAASSSASSKGSTTVSGSVSTGARPWCSPS